MDLASKQCVPCKGDVPPLEGDALDALLAELGGGWRVVDGHHLEKEFRFGNFVEEHGLDFIETAEVGIYTEQDPDTVRAPDYTLISLGRITTPLPQRGYVFGLIPDLVVEVISPDYSVSAAEARAQMWLEAGVRLVVMAYIATQEIVTHCDDGTVLHFGMDDTLTGEPVLPEFACPVADIFAWRQATAGQSE